MFLKKKISLTVLTVCAATLSSFAQTGTTTNKGKTITDETVTVVKEYEATIQDAQKVNIQPSIPDVEDSKPKLDYSIPQKELRDFAFEPNPLKPLSMGKELLERYNTSYIRLGLGSQISPLAQFAYNDDKTKGLRFGLFYNHLSAAAYKNKLKRFSDDEVGAYAKYFPKAVEIGAGFTFHNYRTHFYGIDTSFYGSDTAFREKDVRQIFRTYDAQVYLKNAQRNKADINYSQSLEFNYMQQRETFSKANEWFFAGHTFVEKKFAKIHRVYGIFDFDVSHLKNDSFTLSRNIFTPNLGYGLNNDDWKGHGQFGVAISNGRGIFVTDLYLEKRIYMHNFIVFAGFNRYYQKNSLLSLLQTNNYILNTVPVNNSPTDDFTAGIKGTVFEFSYNLAFNLIHVKNFGFFINDTLDMKRFTVIYDPSTWIYNFHFEAGYNVKEWLRLQAFGDLNLYDAKLENRPWQQPAFTATLRANYVWKNKVIVGADLYAITSSYAKLPGNVQKKLSGTADMNISAEYLFNKHLSLFGTLNNIFNIKYQYWNNYRTYGINGMLGAKYSF